MISWLSAGPRTISSGARCVSGEALRLVVRRGVASPCSRAMRCTVSLLTLQARAMDRIEGAAVLSPASFRWAMTHSRQLLRRVG
ncbi:MAG: hypothetical protein ACKPJD_02845, partial [Planctomycetaceae bacterium]